jgi:hypothetical protein
MSHLLYLAAILPLSIYNVLIVSHPFICHSEEAKPEESDYVVLKAKPEESLLEADIRSFATLRMTR